MLFMYKCECVEYGSRESSKTKIKKTVLRTKVEARNVERNAGMQNEKETIRFVFLKHLKIH